MHFDKACLNFNIGRMNNLAQFMRNKHGIALMSYVA